jgi:hypothetical protein
MTAYTDQAITDAIIAAVSTDNQLVAVYIDTKKFIETFNGHRDRKLCTSLDFPSSAPTTHASLPSGESDPSVTSGFVGAGTAHSPLEAALRAIIIRCDEGDKKSDWLPIISDIAKRALQGAAQTPTRPYGEVLDEMDHQAKYQSATTSSGADGVAAYERGFKDGVFVGREMPNSDDDARARFLADRADTERKQASNPSSQAELCPSCNLPYSNGDTCPAFRGGCPMGGDF